ncbi:hypothetical protein MMC11_007588 [Xylographa trunciseda]|nr:hypothetical protein [Xylographa trunciseda]
MQLTLRLLALTILSSLTTIHASSFYAYSCDGCNCNAFQSLGSGIIGGCANLEDGAAAIGISAAAGSQVTCRLFTDYDCESPYQSIGVASGQTWGCTNAQNGWVYSILCQSMVGVQPKTHHAEPQRASQHRLGNKKPRFESFQVGPCGPS